MNTLIALQFARRWSPAGWRGASTARWGSYLRTTSSSSDEEMQMLTRNSRNTQESNTFWIKTRSQSLLWSASHTLVHFDWLLTQKRKLIKNMWSPSWPMLVDLMCFMTSGDEEWQLRRREWSIIYLYYLNMLKQISKFMVSILCNKLIIILCTALRNRLLTHTYILLLSSTLSANSGARHTLYSLVSITLRAYLRRWRRIKREWTRLIQTEGSTPLNLFQD